jgi:hypothetical protein
MRSYLVYQTLNIIFSVVTCTNWDKQRTKDPQQVHCAHNANQCSRLKSSMPFNCYLALENIPLSKQPFKMQPQIEIEDVA